MSQVRGTPLPIDSDKYDYDGIESTFGLSPIRKNDPRYVDLFGYDINSADHYEKQDNYYDTWHKTLRVIFRGPLFLAEPLTLSVRSSFDQPFSGFNIRALKFVADATQLLTGQNTHFDHIDSFGFRSWVGSEPLAINLSFKFFMGMWGLHDARIEVYNPMAFLSQLCLPAATGWGGLIAPAPNSYAGFSAIVRSFSGIASAISGALFGNGALKLLDNGIQTAASAATSLADQLSAAMSAYRGVYTVIVGGMCFRSMICESAELSFSQDMDSEGFPIFGTARVTFQSVFSAKAGDVPLVKVGNTEQ